MRRLVYLFVILAVSVVAAQRQSFITAEQEAAINGPWSDPAEPFTILGNVHFVGAQNIGSYLFTTPEGHILLDTGMPRMHQSVRANIEKLGFQVSDIEIMISSHAHIDHVGGHALMQEATGARVMAVGDDAKALELGQDISPIEYEGWTPVEVDRVLMDGDTVTLGGTTMRAVWVPGHTPGATTWVTTVQDGGRNYNVVFPGGGAPNAGPRLIGNPKHPNLVDDTLGTYRKLRQLSPDIQLSGHPQRLFAGKIDAISNGVRPHPLLLEPGAWAQGIDGQEARFMERVEAEETQGAGR